MYKFYTTLSIHVHYFLVSMSISTSMISEWVESFEAFFYLAAN